MRISRRRSPSPSTEDMAAAAAAAAAGGGGGGGKRISFSSILYSDGPDLGEAIWAAKRLVVGSTTGPAPLIIFVTSISDSFRKKKQNFRFPVSRTLVLIFATKMLKV